MYGLINKAVRGMAIEKFGEETWKNIRMKAGVDTDDFVAMESYDDAVTYKLVTAASEELGISPEAVLETFGEYWVNYVGQENYGEFMNAAGKTLPEFLENLDQMHARVMLSFPDLHPPSFRVTDQTEGSLTLHYYSSREGLTHLVVGLIRGLGNRFATSVEVDYERTEDGEDEHDIFHVRYQPLAS